MRRFKRKLLSCNDGVKASYYIHSSATRTAARFTNWSIKNRVRWRVAASLVRELREASKHLLRVKTGMAWTEYVCRHKRNRLSLIVP